MSHTDSPLHTAASRGAGATLAELAAVAGPHALLRPVDSGPTRVADVTHDSREAGPGVLFACRPGQHADGHDFAERAVRAGSPALLVERFLDIGAPQIRVESVAQALGFLAATVHGSPARRLAMLGVTGTNGKTTTAYLLESILASAGHRTGLVGTVETRIAGQAVAGLRTTPESTDLQRLLRRMVDEGVTGAAMEVSSHGLALGRVNGMRFAAAMFTNLTQDHLDFHGSLEEYFATKASLFTPRFTEVGIVNIDDPYGRRLAESAEAPVVTMSPSGQARADVWAADVEAGPEGTAFTARLGSRAVAVRTRLAGGFNVANALGALAAADAAGIGVEAAAAGIAALAGVPGRMERVEAGQPYTVIVDYAHTPDSVRHVLRAARELTSGRVIIVLGCGGDRDRGKRPLMGRVAADLADLAVLTSDNPRTEDPLEIIEQMQAGARQVAVPGRWTVEADRRAAIGAALAAATAGDVVVIAGKGHETYQETAHGTVDFDDRVIARELLEATR